MTDIEKLVKEIEAFAKAKGVQPSTVLRHAIGAGHDRFERLANGDGDMKSRTIRRVRDYIRLG